jgi:hypothetical protein
MKPAHRLIRRPVVVLGVTAAILYNNWLLGPVLNYPLFQHDGSISEYSAGSQPFSWLFRGLDIGAGLSIVIVGYLLWKQLKSRPWGRPLAIWVAILGAANILDALLVLPCSETLNRGCRVLIGLSPHHFQMPPHAYSSTLIGVCYLIAPIYGLVYAQRHSLRTLYFISALTVLEAVYSLISAVVHYYSVGSVTVATSGLGQEVQMIIIGLWLAAASWSLFFELPSRHKSTRGGDSQ